MAWQADVLELKNEGHGISMKVAFTDGTTKMEQSYFLQTDADQQAVESSIEQRLKDLSAVDAMAANAVTAFSGKSYSLDAGGKLAEK